MEALQLPGRGHREKYPQIVGVPQPAVAGVAPLHQGHGAAGHIDGLPQGLGPAAEGPVGKGLPRLQRRQHLPGKALNVDVAAGGGQALLRPLLGPEEKVVHVYHRALQHLLQGCGQGGLAGPAAAVNGH